MTKTKFYLRPFGVVNSKDGLSLIKKDNAFKVNESYFTHIELIRRDNLIKKKLYSFNEFKEILKKQKKIKSIFENYKNLKNNKLEKLLFAHKRFSIFGILNITPDSFSDGGDNVNIKDAIKNAQKMISYGANFIDVGGESTRPGADLISPQEEIMRILPVIQKLNNQKINISLDTRNSSTMEFGILSGVKIINDVSGLNHDRRSVDLINKHNVPIIIMHMPGTPKTMKKKTKYENVVLDVYDYLKEKTDLVVKAGVKRENIIIDPGIGFGKDYLQNIDLISNIGTFHTLGFQIMLGVSRKRFIDSISREALAKNRIGGTISATLYAMINGVRIHRVHDVRDVNQATIIYDRIIN